MKKIRITLIMGLMLAALMSVAACTENNQAESQMNDTQDDVIERVTPTEIVVHTETTDNTEKHIQDFEKLSEMMGTYHYTSDYGTGRLMIEATEDGIDISDYESEDTYRFLANETNVKNEEENKVGTGV